MRNAPLKVTAKQVPIWSAGFAVALVLMGAKPDPAVATGTLYCTIDDRNLSFDVLGNTGMDYGTIVGVQRGRLRLKPGRYVKNAAEFTVGKDNIFQQWDFANDLRFAIRLDDPDNARSIILAIITMRDEKLEKYVGRYVLQFVSAAATKTLTDRARCEGD